MLSVGVITPFGETGARSETDVFRGGGGSDWAGACRKFGKSPAPVRPCERERE